jgi:hypothetical protein
MSSCPRAVDRPLSAEVVAQELREVGETLDGILERHGSLAILVLTLPIVFWRLHRLLTPPGAQQTRAKTFRLTQVK